MTDMTAEKLAIMELAARFEIAFDQGNINDHMATWGDEMSFESPFGTYSDKPSYREWVEGFSKQMMEQYGGTRHIVTNHVISVDGDSAAMTAYLIIFGRNSGGKDAAQAVIAGTAACTDDKLRKINSEWKFVHRTLVFDQAG